MARISVRTIQGGYVVTLKGRPKHDDLRRLERACGAALEHKHPPLTLRLHQVTETDEPARAFLRRLADRGATVLSGESVVSRGH